MPMKTAALVAHPKMENQQFRKAYTEAAYREFELGEAGWTVPESATLVCCASCCKIIHLDSVEVVSRISTGGYMTGQTMYDLACAECAKMGDTMPWWEDTGRPPGRTGTTVVTTAAPKEEKKKKIDLDDNVRATWNSLGCSVEGKGHLHVYPLKTIKSSLGALLLSSSSGSGAHASPEADAALFFDKAWDYKWKQKGTVRRLDTILQKGDNGLEWPEFEIVTPEQKVTAGPVTIIEWPDRSVPNREMITAYVEAAAEMIEAGKTVQVGCIGGHGRTGTFAALVLSEVLHRLEKPMPASRIINLLRATYCSKAIETETQEDFIFTYNGEEPPASGKVRTPVYGGTGSYYSAPAQIYNPSTKSFEPAKLGGKPA